MGQISSCCGKNATKHVIDTKKDMKKGSDTYGSGSRQTQDTFSESTAHSNLLLLSWSYLIQKTIHIPMRMTLS